MRDGRRGSAGPQEPGAAGREVDGGGSTDIRGQMLGVDALRNGGDFRVSGAKGLLTEQHPDLAFGTGSLQFLVVWTDRRNFTERRDDIYGRRVSG